MVSLSATDGRDLEVVQPKTMTRPMCAQDAETRIMEPRLVLKERKHKPLPHIMQKHGIKCWKTSILVAGTCTSQTALKQDFLEVFPQLSTHMPLQITHLLSYIQKPFKILLILNSAKAALLAHSQLKNSNRSLDHFRCHHC
jgi:hypothetical protein